MKTTNIYRLMAALAVSALMMSCDDDSKLNADGDNGQDGIQNVVPVFPDLVEDYEVEPGSTLELVFTPNLDWTVSIPSKIRQWFWINDESFKVTELSGKASEDPVTVHIGVTENAEFDKNYSCEVTLEMGDSSAVIAKYMLPAKEKKSLHASFAPISPAPIKPLNSSLNQRQIRRNHSGESKAAVRLSTESETPICTSVPDAAPSGMCSR